MKKDGIELFNEGKYKIHDTDVWKTVYRLNRDDETEYYIKTRENGFERVWRRSGTYALNRVMDELKCIPEKIMRRVEEMRSNYADVVRSRGEYNTEADWRFDERRADAEADGFVEALVLADVLRGRERWYLLGYILGYSD